MIHESTENGITLLTIEISEDNSFSLTDMDELKKKVSIINKDESIMGFIITGSNRKFCLGVKIEEMLRLDNDLKIVQFFRTIDELLICLFSVNKPLIIAINGHSVGLGFLIQLCADYTFSVENDKIKFGLPEFDIGLAIDSVMKDLVSFNNISGRKLSRLIYSSKLFSIEKALQLGVVDEVVEKDFLISLSIAKIKELVQNNPDSFKINKSILRDWTLSNMVKSFNEERYKIFIDLLKNQETLNKLRKIK